MDNINNTATTQYGFENVAQLENLRTSAKNKKEYS
jgi:hypothetical protein